ncbi:MAG TPA: orotidine-5'-phosphate decarboxylase [Bacteroidota bacterium]|nr:orotidine-5'-phosphate decarboxylase [Bacteroidota bacterium]
MTTFLKKLRSIQKKNNSLLCIGLDTAATEVPESLYRWGDPQYEFNRRIIDATRDLVCAYKFNVAFYESAGEHGWYTIHQSLARIPEEIVTIGDGKRGDIASSSERQALLFCEDWEFSASTVNPYMGKDSVAPFLRRKDQCAFILAVTSNDGARDFQRLPVRGRPLYEHVVKKALTWNRNENVGFVVGATRPAELKRIRSLAPESPLLIPGIGAQKGSLEAAVRYGCTADGDLAVINAGRSIIYASRGDDFADRARAEALKLRDQINRYREKYFG